MGPADFQLESREVLEPGYLEGVAVGLEAAVRARAPLVHASTPLVRGLAVRTCGGLGLGERERALVDVCARVRDVGMLALPDTVVLAVGSLSAEQWELVTRHPVLGAELLESLEGMEPAAAIVRSHHERWDGEGYPDGERGDRIPLLSRVIAACDAFVALSSDRPHRRGATVEAALEQLDQERGSQFDPVVVHALTGAITGRRSRAPGAGGRSSGRRDAGVKAGAQGARDLKDAISGFDVVPAFEPAVERLLRALARKRASRGELAAAVESDIGLTLAIVRAAHSRSDGRAALTVFDAVASLKFDEIGRVIEDLPRAAFPWRTPIESVLHRLRVHTQAVARAAERIARELGLRTTDELVLAALVHDVGKLPFAQARGALEGSSDVRSRTPEQRVLVERQATGLDHASIGGLLLSRWGLPARLSDLVSAHHSAKSEGELATVLRLADMVAHHAQGDAIDRRLMLDLARTCGLPLRALREALFDLPHAGGSQRRRAEPSPLSIRETAVLRGLAEGKIYKEIAGDLGLSASTVRSHLHNAYAKLEVTDRAQAVLRATEMAWL